MGDIWGKERKMEVFFRGEGGGLKSECLFLKSAHICFCYKPVVLLFAFSIVRRENHICSLQYNKPTG